MGPAMRDCLREARYPRDLSFRICWQRDELERLPISGDDRRFRIDEVPWWRSRGLGWPRRRCVRGHFDVYEALAVLMEIVSEVNVGHSIHPMWMVTSHELVVDFNLAVNSIDHVFTDDRAKHLGGRAQERRPPTKRGVCSEDRPREIKSEKIVQPIEDQFFPEVLRSFWIAPTSSGPLSSMPMPTAKIVVGYPLNHPLVDSESLHCTCI